MADNAAALIECGTLRPAADLPEVGLARLAGAIIDGLGVLAIDYVRLDALARRDEAPFR